MAGPKKNPELPPEDERSRFARFAKKLVNVPKKEIDEKAKEWREREHRPQADRRSGA